MCSSPSPPSSRGRRVSQSWRLCRPHRSRQRWFVLESVGRHPATGLALLEAVSGSPLSLKAELFCEVLLVMPCLLPSSSLSVFLRLRSPIQPPLIPSNLSVVLGVPAQLESGRVACPPMCGGVIRRCLRWRELTRMCERVKEVAVGQQQPRVRVRVSAPIKGGSRTWRPGRSQRRSSSCRSIAAELLPPRLFSRAGRGVESRRWCSARESARWSGWPQLFVSRRRGRRDANLTDARWSILSEQTNSMACAMSAVAT